jgi:hypothetical protein
MKALQKKRGLVSYSRCSFNGEHLTDQSVLHILKMRAVQASVASFSLHDLRRSIISDLLDAGADISTAQQLAGHSNVQNTARFNRRGEATKRRAAQLLHVPYFGGGSGDNHRRLARLRRLGSHFGTRQEFDSIRPQDHCLRMSGCI